MEMCWKKLQYNSHKTGISANRLNIIITILILPSPPSPLHTLSHPTPKHRHTHTDMYAHKANQISLILLLVKDSNKPRGQILKGSNTHTQNMLV